MTMTRSGGKRDEDRREPEDELYVRYQRLGFLPEAQTLNVAAAGQNLRRLKAVKTNFGEIEDLPGNA